MVEMGTGNLFPYILCTESQFRKCEELRENVEQNRWQDGNEEGFQGIILSSMLISWVSNETLNHTVLSLNDSKS